MRECLRLLASAQRSERTAKTYASIAKAFLAFAGDRIPRREDVERFLAKPLRSGARASAATRNQALAAIRALARSATRTRVWTEDPTRELTFEREPEKDPAVLYLSEVQDFFRAVPDVSAPQYHTRD
jgi:site-specific recombinase XerD